MGLPKIVMCLFFCWLILQSFFLGKTTPASDFHSPRTAALGGSGHAGPLLNDSIFLNPAFASLLPTYSLSGNYLWFNGGEVLPDGSSVLSGKNYNVSVQDGRTQLFQAGVGYTVLKNGKFIHIGASKAALKRVAFGVGAKLFFPDDKSRSQILDSMVSVTLIAGRWLQVVAVVDNLRSPSEARERGLQREFIIGTKFNLVGAVLIYFDPHWVPALGSGIFGHESALEFTVMSDFFIRLGAFRNSKVPFLGVYGRGYGLGIGWIAPRISMDYGMERTIEPIAAVAHTIGMTVFF